jgi:hypothetical protein
MAVLLTIFIGEELPIPQHGALSTHARVVKAAWHDLPRSDQDGRGSFALGCHSLIKGTLR